jgi:hypothetical protein
MITINFDNAAPVLGRSKNGTNLILDTSTAISRVTMKTYSHT